MPLDFFVHKDFDCRIYTNFSKNENSPAILIDDSKIYENIADFFFDDPKFFLLPKSIFPMGTVYYKDNLKKFNINSLLKAFNIARFILDELKENLLFFHLNSLSVGMTNPPCFWPAKKSFFSQDNLKLLIDSGLKYENIEQYLPNKIIFDERFNSIREWLVSILTSDVLPEEQKKTVFSFNDNEDIEEYVEQLEKSIFSFRELINRRNDFLQKSKMMFSMVAGISTVLTVFLSILYLSQSIIIRSFITKYFVKYYDSVINSKTKKTH